MRRAAPVINTVLIDNKFKPCGLELNQVQSELPTPSATERARSAQLLQLLHQYSSTQPITFSQFMHHALYEPGLGYYSAGQLKFGAAGDFVTAAELGPIFARCLARYVARNLNQLERPVVLEIGPGSGALAADLLEALQALDCLPDDYYLLEPSADLRERQQARLRARLSHLATRLHWIDRWPSRFEGVVLAIEVLDAMPCERVVCDAGDIKQIRLAVDATGAVIEQLDDMSHDLAAQIGELPTATWPVGYRTEINLWLRPWLQELFEILERGIVVVADYGYPRAEYYRPERLGGTLQCCFRHRVHDDPYILVGLQDISANIDFTAVADAGCATGFELAAYTSQAQFLLGEGLADEVASIKAAPLPERLRLSQQLQLLSSPNAMGERFQLLALSKAVDARLAGFNGRDLSYRL